MAIEVNGGVEDKRFLFRDGVMRDVEAFTIAEGKTTITDTGTVAKVGSIVRFENGAYQYMEAVVVDVPSANSFSVSARLSSLVVGDDFYILQRATQRVDESGAQLVVSSSTPVQYVDNGVDTETELDTVTPANTRALPVRQIQASGLPADVATEAKQDDIITELQDLNAVDYATATNQDDIINNVAAVEAAVDNLRTVAAKETTLGTLAGKDFATSAKQDTQITKLTSIDGKDFATSAKQDTQITKLTSIDGKDFATGAKQDLALAKLTSIDGKDFATSAKQDSLKTSVDGMSAKLPATLGQKAMAASMSVALASDQPSLPVTPAVKAAVTVKNAAVAVGITAVRLTTDGAAPSATRQSLKFQASTSNTGNIYIGASGVTTATGMPIFPGQIFDFKDDANDYYMISDTAAQAVYVVEAE